MRNGICLGATSGCRSGQFPAQLVGRDNAARQQRPRNSHTLVAPLAPSRSPWRGDAHPGFHSLLSGRTSIARFFQGQYALEPGSSPFVMTTHVGRSACEGTGQPKNLAAHRNFPSFAALRAMLVVVAAPDHDGNRGRQSVSPQQLSGDSLRVSSRCRCRRLMRIRADIVLHYDVLAATIEPFDKDAGLAWIERVTEFSGQVDDDEGLEFFEPGEPFDYAGQRSESIGELCADGLRLLNQCAEEREQEGAEMRSAIQDMRGVFLVAEAKLISAAAALPHDFDRRRLPGGLVRLAPAVGVPAGGRRQRWPLVVAHSRRRRQGMLTVHGAAIAASPGRRDTRRRRARDSRTRSRPASRAGDNRRRRAHASPRLR